MRKFKLRTMFTALILVLFLIVIPTTVAVYDLFPLVLMNERPAFTRLLGVCIVSSVIGTIISRAASKSTMNLISEIDQATKEIANGNYNIRLEEKSRLIELNDMAQNFNLMAKDLAATEIMRTDFVSNVSHEFKTPLTAIEGYATLLQNENLSKEQIKEYAENIEYNTKKLTKMTSNILLLSSLDNGKKDIDKVKFSLDEQIRETVLMFEREWNVRNIDLDLELEDCEYKGHKEILGHVWSNIFGNALKFSEDNSEIVITLTQNSSGITVAIKDSGKGIEKEDIEHVFEKFYQADTSRASKGNGLGLAIVKTAVDLHGGTVTVQSDIGKGTEFIVCLPTNINDKIKK